MMSLANPSSGKFSYFQVNSSNRISHMSPSVLSVSNHTKRKFPRIKCASMALTSSPVKYSPSNIENFRVDKKPVEARIGDWMEGSVTDIVQNLKQAPLLVHVYPPEVDRAGNPKFEFKIEKAIRKNWPIVKSMWRSSEIRSPDGLIFVEELVDDENSSINEGQSLEDDELDGVDGVTRAWGIVVQGRGVKCGPACYLLKTTRVEAGCGLGLFCTHFCLTKVTDYRETAFRQLQDFWLLP